MAVSPGLFLQNIAFGDGYMLWLILTCLKLLEEPFQLKDATIPSQYFYLFHISHANGKVGVQICSVVFLAIEIVRGNGLH